MRVVHRLLIFLGISFTFEELENNIKIFVSGNGNILDIWIFVYLETSGNRSSSKNTLLFCLGHIDITNS